MSRVFMKGCEAIAEAAVRAGCRFFAGHPITPQHEIPESFSRRLPAVGRVFVQGQSEVAAATRVHRSPPAAAWALRTSSSLASPAVPPPITSPVPCPPGCWSSM